MEKERRSWELKGLRHKRSRLWVSLEFATVNYEIIQTDPTLGVSSGETGREVREGVPSMGVSDLWGCVFCPSPFVNSANSTILVIPGQRQVNRFLDRRCGKGDQTLPGALRGCGQSGWLYRYIVLCFEPLIP